MKSISVVIQQIRAIVTMLTSGRVKLLALSLMISVLVVACGSDSTPAEPESNNAPAASEGSSATPAPSSEGGSSDALPGTEEFGLTKEGLVTSIEAVESHIATCMSEAGFEYIAVDYNTVRKGMKADKSLPGLSEKEYIDLYGYGISTLYTGLSPQLAEETTPAKIGLGEQNIQIFNNLSPADQVAYNRTLFGENSEATFAVGIEIEDFSRTGGCTRAAIEQVFTPEQLNTTYVNPKDVLVEQDPRMIAALAEFAQCMRAEGFDYNYEREIEPDLKKRLDAITDGAPIESLSAEAQAALTELQGEERVLAVVTYKCESTILDPVEAQVEKELFAGYQG
jgi:hypothetical protein